MLIAFGAVSGSFALAQTAHLSQTQTVLNIPSTLNYAMGVAVDTSGNIYVADQYNSRVLKLTPSAGGFIQNTIGTGLLYPYGVAVDANNNVYIADISLTTLLKETPNGSGGYIQSTIGSDLYDAVSVAVDSQGNVFGVEINNSFIGSLFKETLSGGVYTQSFLPAPGTHGVSTVAVDGLGNLFLDDGWDNKVFEDTPIGGGFYATTEIYVSPGALAVDQNNNLYIASFPGFIDKLTPNGSGGFNTSYIPTDSSFNDGDYYGVNYGVDYFDAGGLAVDGKGNLFFTDLYTFELIEESMLPANFGQVPVGVSSNFPVSMFFTFDTGGTLGSYSVLTDGVPKTEFIDSNMGNCYWTYSYSQGSTCDVDVYLTPAAPGTRSGAVVLNNGIGNPFATGYVQGIGVSPLVAFAGAAPAPLVTGLFEPSDVVVDAAGNILVANSGTGNVLLTAPGGAQSTIGSGFTYPTGVAEDGAGNIFVADSGSVYEIAKTTGVQTQLNISGLTDPSDLAVDGAGNLYISEPNSSTVLKVTPAGVQTTVGTGLISPRGIAVDSAGNVYIADFPAGSVYVVAPSGTQSTISGLASPSGVTVDPAGNVYVAIYGTGEVVEVAPGGARAILESGQTFPHSVALDASGNLYFTEGGVGTVQKIDRTDAPSLNFATTAVGSTSIDSPQLVTLANDGNAALSFPVPNSGNNPSISTNFNLQGAGAGDCPLVAASSSQPGTLAAGASCQLPISFTPLTGATFTGSLALTDTDLNAASPTYAVQSIQLSGATPGWPTIISVSPIASQQTQTITITGSSFGTQAPYTGDSSSIELVDSAGVPWVGGHTGNGVTLAVSSWTDSQIVLSGLSGSYGTTHCIRPGDHLSVSVWNAQSGNGPAVYPLVAASGTDNCPTKISSVSPIVSQQAQTITISGEGFGIQAAYTGDSNYIELADTAGTPWAAGHTGNGITLAVSSWADSQIVITGLSGSYGTNHCIRPGDLLNVSVWNAQTGAGPSVYPIVASGGTDNCPTKITLVSPIVSEQAQTITISGEGFGTQGAYTGDSDYIELEDTAGVPWAAGYSGNGIALAISSWTDSQIVITGFSGSYGTNHCIRPGDHLNVSVWNAQTGAGAAVYPIVASGGTDNCPTEIASVSPILPKQTQTITITGLGFGTQAAYTGDSNYIEVVDGSGTPWAGGHTGNGVTLAVSSWTDSQIVLSGFGGSYGSNHCIREGDQLSISVWNAQTGAGPVVYPVVAGSGSNTCP